MKNGGIKDFFKPLKEKNTNKNGKFENKKKFRKFLTIFFS